MVRLDRPHRRWLRGDLDHHPRPGPPGDDPQDRYRAGSATLVRLFSPRFRTRPDRCPVYRRPGAAADVQDAGPCVPDGQHHRAAQEPCVSAGRVRARLGGRLQSPVMHRRQDWLEMRGADRAYTPASAIEPAFVHVQQPFGQEPGTRLFPRDIAGVPVLRRRVRFAAGGSHAARPAGHGQRHPGVPRNRWRVHGVFRPLRPAEPGRSGHRHGKRRRISRAPQPG
ncbi:hypothetical protein D3C86_1415500 [compost metagenome]